jgi:hypothetical protein
MGMAVISIDTSSQQCTLTVDGALVKADEIEFYYGTDWNNQPLKEFKYTIKTVLPDGMTQDVEYQMASPDTGPNIQNQGPGAGTKQKNGLFSKIINKSEKVSAILSKIQKTINELKQLKSV